MTEAQLSLTVVSSNSSPDVSSVPGLSLPSNIFHTFHTSSIKWNYFGQAKRDENSHHQSFIDSTAA